jgi:hypothetical protein
VPDDGSYIGSGNYQQGDPAKGDIRISGYNFGLSNTLAEADMPPSSNNYSIAGDIQFNTGQPFNIGSTYDLFTVAAHEFGHALGLAETSNTAQAVMYGTYQSAMSGLTSDDIAGIRAIYSNGNPRSPDAYYGSPTPNNSFANAANLTPLINSDSKTAVVNSLNISSPSVAEYYAFTAPAGSADSMTVGVQSSGLSLLAPRLTVYAADQCTVLGSATGSGEQGSTLKVTVSDISPGQQVYVKVAGANTTSFGTGDYALTLNLGTGPAPAVTLPNTQTANGNPLSGGGGLAQTGGLLPVPWLLNQLLGLVDKDADSIGADADAPSAAAAAGGSGGAAPAAHSLPGPVAAAPGPRSITTATPESLAVLVADAIRPPVPLFAGTSGPAAAAPLLAVVAPPATATGAVRPVEWLPAGGGLGGQPDAAEALVEPAAVPAGAEARTAAPGTAPAGGTAAARPAGNPELQMRDALFAEQSWATLPAARVLDVSPADAGAAGSSAAAAAGTLLALGGWGAPSREAERRPGVRRR